jgi:hypothetical protein
LMLLLALNGILSFHAIKKREEQEGEIWLWHFKSSSLWFFLGKYRSGHKNFTVCITLHRILQIRQAGPIWVPQSSCGQQAENQGAFCKGKSDLSLAFVVYFASWPRGGTLIRTECGYYTLFAFSLADHSSCTILIMYVCCWHKATLCWG